MGRRNMPVHLRLVARALPYKRLLLLAVFILTASSILTLATPWLIGYAIDTGLDIQGVGAEGEAIAEGTMGTLLFAVGLIIASAVLRGAFVYAQTYVNEQISQSIAFDFRNDIYDRLQRLSYAYHDTAEIGQIMSRATQDVEGVRFFVSMGVLRFLYIIVLVATAYGLMIGTNTKVGLVAFAFVPLVAVQASITSLMLRPIWLQVQDLQGQMSNVLQENLTGQRVVKAFSRDEFEQQKFDNKVDSLFERSYSTAKFQAFNEPFMMSVWLLSAAVVFWVGVSEIEAGRMSAGELTQFQLYLTLMQVPVRSIGFIVNMFARAHSAGSRIFEIVDAESAVQEKPDAAPVPEGGHGYVRFHNVSFGYDSYSAVIKNLDIEAKPGETVALLGPTGSGKSTVVNLLPRFYDVTEGAITIDSRQHRVREAQRHRRGDRGRGQGRHDPRLHRVAA
jgi:ABC-type multidrug transport system fused ATPase/permease subunit